MKRRLCYITLGMMLLGSLFCVPAIAGTFGLNTVVANRVFDVVMTMSGAIQLIGIALSFTGMGALIALSAATIKAMAKKYAKKIVVAW